MNPKPLFVLNTALSEVSYLIDRLDTNPNQSERTEELSKLLTQLESINKKIENRLRFSLRRTEHATTNPVPEKWLNIIKSLNNKGFESLSRWILLHCSNVLQSEGLELVCIISDKPDKFTLVFHKNEVERLNWIIHKNPIYHFDGRGIDVQIMEIGDEGEITRCGRVFTLNSLLASVVSEVNHEAN